MTEEFFYHYTTIEAAKVIFLSGKILPSLAAKGDAAHGDGVYLTTLEPRLGRDTIKNNNWDGLAGTRDRRVEAYFEICMPSSKVKRTKDKRDIQPCILMLTRGVSRSGMESCSLPCISWSALRKRQLGIRASLW